MAENEFRTVSLEDWVKEGTALYGENQLNWKFACPVCSHVQIVHEFAAHKDKGAWPSSAYQECIGRYTGATEFKDTGKGPCNYAGFGLFKLSPVTVKTDDGKETRCFEFADRKPKA